MTFFWVTFVGRNPLRIDIVSGFYCDAAGEASVEKFLNRVSDRILEADRGTEIAVDKISCCSEADFPPLCYA
jgi:hypothetical protein